MKRIQDLTRRSLLRFSLWLVGGSTSIGFGNRVAARTVPVDALAIRLAQLSNPRVSGRAIGLAYLQQLPRPIALEQLIAQIGERESLEPLSKDALLNAVRERHQCDLQADNTVEVRGWVLSRAEANLYALTQLVGRDST